MRSGNGSALNAGESVRSVDQVQALASVITLVRQRFPAAKANLKPWRDDPQTRQWSEPESLDLSFHFPGWSPRLQCRSLLIQLRFCAESAEAQPSLLGVLMRGMTYDGERWRLATVGEWLPEGPHLPQADQVIQLQMICRDLFELFSGSSAADEAA
jgi:hypothetical protein